MTPQFNRKNSKGLNFSNIKNLITNESKDIIPKTIQLMKDSSYTDLSQEDHGSVNNL